MFAFAFLRISEKFWRKLLEKYTKMTKNLAKILRITNVDFTLNFLQKGKNCQHHVKKGPYLFKYIDDRKIAQIFAETKFRQNMRIFVLYEVPGCSRNHRSM
jgi:hypothetical protein